MVACTAGISCHFSFRYFDAAARLDDRQADKAGRQETHRAARMATGDGNMDPREFEKKTQDELDDILNRWALFLLLRGQT